MKKLILGILLIATSVAFGATKGASFAMANGALKMKTQVSNNQNTVITLAKHEGGVAGGHWTPYKNPHWPNKPGNGPKPGHGNNGNNGNHNGHNKN